MSGQEVPPDVGPPQTGRSRPWLVWGLAALAVIGLGLAGWQWWRAERLVDDAAARRQVATTAGAFGEALLTYSHDDLGAARERIRRYAGEEFVSTYQRALQGGLADLIRQLEATAEATTRRVYVSDVDAATARAIVVIDSIVDSTTGSRDVAGAHLQVELVRRDGTWTVSSASSLTGADGGLLSELDGSGQPPVAPSNGASSPAGPSSSPSPAPTSPAMP